MYLAQGTTGAVPARIFHIQVSSLSCLLAGEYMAYLQNRGATIKDLIKISEKKNTAGFKGFEG